MASVTSRLSGVSRKKMALFLCIGGGLVLMMALVSFLRNLNNSMAYLDAHIELTQGELVNANLPLPEMVELESDLDSKQNLLDALTTLESSIMAGRFDWPGIMRAMSDYDTSRLNLVSFSQEGRQITVHGVAADDLAVSAYARNLEASGVFSRVNIQSMKVVNVPFAGMQPENPIGENAPGPRTPAATAVPGDEYEPDNVDPKSIFPGQPQAHTFWPDGDVDRVKLLAKAGRYYRVSTSKLAAGVDTLVAVSINGRYYHGDDRQLGDLSTEVIFCAEGSQDVEALIEVTNRGEYGPDKSYQLAVDEVIPTPTLMPTNVPTHVPPTVFVPTATHAPTATSMPTAAPTHTSAPTATIVPPTVTLMPTATSTPTATSVPTATPTLDLRDSYEPDEHTPADIAIGETQFHTFYPTNDVDHVRFFASGAAGAPVTYRVRTFDVAPGVDTALLVRVGSNTFIDGVRGDGNPLAQVTFQVASEEPVEVLVDIFNYVSFGPAQGYRLTVEIVEAEPTTEPTAGTENRVAGQRRAPGLASVFFPGRAGNYAKVSLQEQTGTETDAAGAVPYAQKSVEFVIILEPRP